MRWRGACLVSSPCLEDSALIGFSSGEATANALHGLNDKLEHAPQYQLENAGVFGLLHAR